MSRSGTGQGRGRTNAQGRRVVASPRNGAAKAASTKAPYSNPVSPRGRRTRAELLAAARRIFERDGYNDSRIVDITELAQSSAGSFYTYFESKEEILAEVLTQAQTEMLHSVVFDDDDHAYERPIEALRSKLTAYLGFYRDNIRLMLLIEQVAGIDSEFRAARRERELVNVRHNSEVVAAWRDRGLADFEPDPLLITSALSGMVNRFAYNNLALGGNLELDCMIDILTSIWIRSLGLRSEPGVPASSIS
jgi:AcrR family transcriptional regulator